MFAFSDSRSINKRAKSSILNGKNIAPQNGNWMGDSMLLEPWVQPKLKEEL
jgi:hypothetical protein